MDAQKMLFMEGRLRATNELGTGRQELIEDMRKSLMHLENEESSNILKYTTVKWPDISSNELFHFYSEIKSNKVFFL